MKKEYGAPKAEKMEFNYSEAVVASGGLCETGGSYSQMGNDCHDIEDKYSADVNP